MISPHGAVQRAIREGKLPRLDGSVYCADCGRPAVEYDHRDYARPFNVDPVCRSCNHKREKAQNFDLSLPRTYNSVKKEAIQDAEKKIEACLAKGVKSSRQIAKVIGVSHSTVWKILRHLKFEYKTPWVLDNNKEAS